MLASQLEMHMIKSFNTWYMFVMLKDKAIDNEHSYAIRQRPNINTPTCWTGLVLAASHSQAAPFIALKVTMMCSCFTTAYCSNDGCKAEMQVYTNEQKYSLLHSPCKQFFLVVFSFLSYFVICHGVTQPCLCSAYKCSGFYPVIASLAQFMTI